MSLYGWNSRSLTVCTLALALAATSARAERSAEAGVWFDDTGRGAVEVSQCGQSLCGHIVWLQKPTDANGNPLTDRLNPARGQRSRPICGLQVLGGLKRMSDGSWDEGWIYDPKQGKRFDVQITAESPRRLRVVGYKGLKIFSRTLIWKRAPADLERCD